MKENGLFPSKFWGETREFRIGQKKVDRKVESKIWGVGLPINRPVAVGRRPFTGVLAVGVVRGIRRMCSVGVGGRFPLGKYKLNLERASHYYRGQQVGGEATRGCYGHLLEIIS